jgi:hypothetical protein
MITLDAATPIVLKKEPMGCVPMLMTSGIFSWALPTDVPKNKKIERTIRKMVNLFMVKLLSVILTRRVFPRA